MKNSYILNSLVASLKSLEEKIIKRPNTIYQTAWIRQELDAIYMDTCRITDLHAEDKCVTKSFSKNVGDIVVYEKENNITHITKDDYIKTVQNLVELAISDAADNDFYIDGYNAEPEATPAPPAADETPGDKTTPPQSSEIDFNKIIKLLKNIDNNMQKLIQIFKKYEK